MLKNAVQFHKHTGLDAPKIDIKFKVLTAVPDYAGMQGELVLTAISSVYNLYAFIDGDWRNLTGNV